MSENIVGHKAKISFFRELRLGQYGFVVEGSYDGKVVAVKRLTRQTGPQDGRNFKSEIELIKKAKHPNIVECLFDDEDENFFYIVMKKCRYSLQDYFSKSGYGIMRDLKTRLQMCYHPASGLAYLHSVGILHRDIKMSNLLLFEVGYQVMVQIADFGLSKELGPGRTSTSTMKAGTPGYKAYEILNGRKIKKSSDTFSLGITFHEMLTEGKHPFSNDADNKDYRIKQMKPPNVSKVTDSDLGSLVGKMVAHDNRPTSELVKAELVLKHIGRKVSKASSDYKRAETDLGAPIPSSAFGWDYGTTSSKTTDGEDKIEEPTTTFAEKAHASTAVSPMKRTNPHQTSNPAKKRIKVTGNIKGSPQKSLRAYAAKKKVKCGGISSTKENIPVLLETTEAQAYRGDWDDAQATLGKALALLNSYSSLTSSFFQKLSESCEEEPSFPLRAILFRACEATQHRAEKKLNDGCFKTGHCIQQICSLMKKMIDVEPTDELAEGIRFKDVAKCFVCPVILKMYGDLESMTGIFPTVMAKHKAFALDWIARAHMNVEELDKAIVYATDGMKNLEKKFSIDELQTLSSYTRLLHCQGEIFIRLRKYDEAKAVLQQSINTKENAQESTAFTTSLLKQIPEKYVSFVEPIAKASKEE